MTGTATYLSRAGPSESRWVVQLEMPTVNELGRLMGNPSDHSLEASSVDSWDEWSDFSSETRSGELLGIRWGQQ
jgi:hypothetical protein